MPVASPQKASSSTIHFRSFIKFGAGLWNSELAFILSWDISGEIAATNKELSQIF